MSKAKKFPPRKRNIKEDSRELLPRRLVIYGIGEETEKNYIDSLIKAYRLNAHFKIEKKFTGYDPLQMVQMVATDFTNLTEEDKIFIITDTDEFTNIQQARNLAKKLGYVFIESNPCFEYWLIKHLQVYPRPFSKTGKKSIADVCIETLENLAKNFNCCNEEDKKLCKTLQSYQKSDDKLYMLSQHRLDNACQNAKKSTQNAKNYNNPNPSTNFYELIEFCQQYNS